VIVCIASHLSPVSALGSARWNLRRPGARIARGVILDANRVFYLLSSDTFCSIFPQISYFLLINYCNVDPNEQIFSSRFIRSEIIKVDVQDTLQVQ
jgi:hypothetical protein